MYEIEFCEHNYHTVFQIGIALFWGWVKILVEFLFKLLNCNTETLCHHNYMAKYQAKNLNIFPLQRKGPNEISRSTHGLLNLTPPPSEWRIGIQCVLFKNKNKFGFFLLGSHFTIVSCSQFLVFNLQNLANLFVGKLH